MSDLPISLRVSLDQLAFEADQVERDLKIVPPTDPLADRGRRLLAKVQKLVAKRHRLADTVRRRPRLHGTTARQVTLREAAALLGYSVPTVRRLIKADRLKATGAGALLRVPMRSIETLLKELAEGAPIWLSAKARASANADMATGRSTPRRAAKGSSSRSTTGMASSSDDGLLQPRPPKRFAKN
jgi:excisionase family DNA binding protein